MCLLSQKIVNVAAPRPNPLKENCLAVDAAAYTCPQTDPYGSWCAHLEKDPALWQPVHDTYGILSTLFSFQAPVNTRLCPIGKCSPTCTCRETLLKHLTLLLMAEDKAAHGFSGEGQTEFTGEEKDEL